MFGFFRSAKLPYALILIAGIAIGLWYSYFAWGKSVPAESSTQRVLIAESFPERQFVVGVKIGEETFPFIVDTGADTVSVSPEVAEKSHLIPLEQGSAVGIGGRVKSTKVRIPEMRIGGIIVRNIEASVLPTPMNLLGMTFLEQLKRVEIKDGILTFEQ